MKSVYRHKWSMLFEIANLGNMDKPLNPEILANPLHKVTKHILYLYSMETFIYSDLNCASRLKDKSKLKFYGAFAAALSFIITFANQNRRDSGRLQGANVLYRGLRLPEPEVLGCTFAPGSRVHLMGYTSTSRRAEVAMMFATGSGIDSEERNSLVNQTVPVVFRIHFHGPRGLFQLTPGYTAYQGEGEVLVQDGLEYSVVARESVRSANPAGTLEYYLIDLRYPA